MKQYLCQSLLLLSMLASNDALKAAPSEKLAAFEQQILQKKISPSHVVWSMCIMLPLTLSLCALEVSINELGYSGVDLNKLIPSLEVFSKNKFKLFFRNKWFKEYYLAAYLIGWLATACVGFVINYALLHLSLKRGWKRDYNQTALALLLNIAAVFSMFCVLNEGLIGFLGELGNQQKASFLTDALLLSVGIGSIYVLGWKTYGFFGTEFPNGLLAQDPGIQALWHEQILERKISPVNMVWSICSAIGATALGVFTQDAFFDEAGSFKFFFREKWFKESYATAYLIVCGVTACISFATNYGLLYNFLKRGWRGAQIPTTCLLLLNIAEAFFMLCVLNKGLIGLLKNCESNPEILFLIRTFILSVFIGLIFYFFGWKGYGFLCALFPKGFLISDQQVVGWLHLITGACFKKK